MNVIDEFAELLSEAPALSPHTRDRAKEKLMNELMTLDCDERYNRPAKPAPRARRRRARRVGFAAVLAIAAAVALVVGIGSPGGHSPLSPPPASAATLALRAAAAGQRALPDTPPDLTGVAPDVAALAPLMHDFPTDGTTAEVWAWVDVHCQAAQPAAGGGEPVGALTPAQRDDEHEFLAHQDCGLLAVFAFLQVSTPAQSAALLDAIASLPTLTTLAGNCTPGAGPVLHGPSQEFRVSRNGTDTVLTLTHSPTGRVEMSMMLWLKTVPPPCPRVVPNN